MPDFFNHLRGEPPGAGATLSGIYTAALYQYASEGKMGEGFSSEMVKEAFRPT